jgi:hypothetical protein
MEIVSTVIALAQEIYAMKEQYKANNADCAALAARVHIFVAPLGELKRRNRPTEVNSKLAALEAVNETMDEVKAFIVKYSKPGAVRIVLNILNGKSYSKRLSNLHADLTEVIYHFIISFSLLKSIMIRDSAIFSLESLSTAIPTEEMSCEPQKNH